MNTSKSISIVFPRGSTRRSVTRPDRDAAVANRARDVESEDVLSSVGDHRDRLHGSSAVE